MAVNSSAGAGVVIDSYAMSDDSIPSQTGLTDPDNEILFATTVDASSGNQVTGGNIATASYVGRVVVLRRNTATEEIRQVTAVDGAGTTATVNAPWDTNPAAGDAVDVFYTLEDLELQTGVNLASKTGAYEFSREIVIEAGTTTATNPTLGAGLQVTNIEYLESADKGSNDQSIQIRDNGFMLVGFDSGAGSQSGAVVTSANIRQNTTGTDDFEPMIGVIGSTASLSGRLEVYDSIFWSQRDPVNFEVLDNNKAVVKDSRIIGTTGTMALTGDSSFVRTSIAGRGNSGEKIRVSESTVFDEVVITNTNGIDSINENVGVAETFTLSGVTFISNLDDIDISVSSSKTFIMVDPVWNITQASDINWDGTPTNAQVDDRRSIKGITQSPDGTAIASAAIIFYYETDQPAAGTENLVESSSDANGLFVSNWPYKVYSYNGSSVLTTTTSSLGAFRADIYGRVPFASAQTITEKFSGTINLPTDTNINAVNASTALTNGSGVSVDRPTDGFGYALVEYENGTGTLTEVATNSAGGAGTIVLKTGSVPTDGDATAGKVLIDRSNATAFSGTISTSQWSATVVSEIKFNVVVDGNNKSLSQIYDYLAARSAEIPLAADGETINKWGNRNQARMLKVSAGEYFTEVSGAEGVFIHDYSTGTVSQSLGFMSDNGVDAYTPPASATLKLTGIKDGTEVRVWDSIDNTLVAGAELVSGGVGTDTTAGVLISGSTDNNTFEYTYVVENKDVFIVLIALEYEYFKIPSAILDADGFEQSVSQRVDRNYLNP